MMKPIPYTALLAALTALPVFAADRSRDPEAMDPRATMEHRSIGEGDVTHGDTSAGADGEGVINAVDADNRVVNITHGPIPALSWPAMTMDLPVAESVDLDGLQPGNKVRFRVVLGTDQVYRITAVDVAP